MSTSYRKGKGYQMSRHHKEKQKPGWTAWEEATVESPYPPRKLEDLQTTWLNSRYQVERYELPNGITYLSMKRLHKEAIHDWRELLRIKNELTHPMREGMELYPAMTRCQDTSNQYHMFVLPLGKAFNLGWTDQNIEAKAPDKFDHGKARQRPLPGWMTPWKKSQESDVAPFAMGENDVTGGIDLLLNVNLTSGRLSLPESD